MLKDHEQACGYYFYFERDAALALPRCLYVKLSKSLERTMSGLQNRMVEVVQIKVVLKVTNVVADHKRPIKASLGEAKRPRRLILKGNVGYTVSPIGIAVYFVACNAAIELNASSTN